MISLLIAATLTIAAPQDSVPQLREDNIKEIVSLMTIDEKCSLIIGGRNNNFNGIGYVNSGVPGAAGVDVLLAPGANIHRNPLCGRNFEYYSEDPLLTGKVAAAMINGIESNGVGTSLKHFAVNNQEYNRLANNSILSERTLREIYLRNFEIAVKESQPWTIMTSYNFINGEHASQSTRLLTDILRGEWGFEGVVMTDWAAGYDQAQIVRAGNEMIQPGSNRRYKQLKEAIEDGSLSMADVDRAVERILQLVVKTPKFKGYKPSEAPDLKAHALVCKKVADEGVILLKNNKSTLPVSRDKEIALFGVTSYEGVGKRGFDSK